MSTCEKFIKDLMEIHQGGGHLLKARLYLLDVRRALGLIPTHLIVEFFEDDLHMSKCRMSI